VSATGLVFSPAATARLTSTSRKRRQAGSPVSAIQSGSSIHSPTSCSRRNDSSTQVKVALEPLIARAVSTSSPIVTGGTGPVALNAPASPRSPRSTSQEPRSRASMNCTWRPLRPGARTSPPRATRFGQ
jgi:hypothetical protein